jgi:hypothetical protein
MEVQQNMKQLRTALLCLAAAACLTCAASAAGVTRTTATIGGAKANVVYVSLTDNTVVAPVLANNSVSTDAPASSIISGAPGKVVAAINGNFFNSYYKTGQAITPNTGNYPRIFSVLMSEGRLICTGSTVGLGFGYDGSLVMGRVNARAVATLGGTPFVCWGVNTIYNDPSAVYMLTDEFNYPVNIPSSSTIVAVSGGKVISMDPGRSGYVVPTGVEAVVIGGSYGTRDVQTGDDAECSCEFTGSGAGMWSGMRNIIGGTGMIVENGAVAVDNNPNVTAADQKPDVTGLRSFAALTADGRLMLCTVSSSYRAIAKSLVAMGVKNAMTLDGGGSSMLYSGGSYATTAGRKLSSILAVLDPDGITGPASAVPAVSVPSSWAKADVDSARSLGILPASIDSSYQRSITRGEFCSLIGGYISAKMGMSFTDYCVTQGCEPDASPFYDTNSQDAACAAALGIVAGYSDGSFRPNDNIKRQDAAIMLRRLAEQTGVVQGGQPMSFTDYGQISSYARESVDFVSALGIMSGNANGTFGPVSNITREQAVVTIMYMWKNL